MKTKKTAMQKFKEMRYSQFINTNINTLAVKVKEESEKLKETCFILVNELVTKMPNGYDIEFDYQLIGVTSESFNRLPKEIKNKFNHSSEKMNFVFTNSHDKEIDVVIL
jgi:hypothetical protein